MGMGMSVDLVEQCKRDFAQEYGAAPEAIVRAPGRVNLIGEHTDYHEGFVLPAAIQPAITLPGRRRDDRLQRVYSRTLGARFVLPLDAEALPPERWAHYFQGVLRVLPVENPPPGGADVLVEADLSYGGGLASSSALVVGFSALLARLYDLPLDARALALLGCDAEHWYGTTGGIMDHFVISHARAGHALLLDCRSLDHRQVPLPREVAIVVADTRTRHDQLNSPFAQRRREAEAGLRVLQDRYPDVKTMRDVDGPRLDRARDALLAADATGLLWRRCRHVVTENARTQAAAVALASGDLSAMGRLMAESHASLRDNYEVSSPALDALVVAAMASPGCLGTRMTGGGFGGCTVSLVARESVDAFSNEVARRYCDATGTAPVVFATTPADGVTTLFSI
jgi:galactokinase